MTNSAFHKVYYKFTFTIKVIDDAVSSFRVIACKLLKCRTCLQHTFPDFKKHLVAKPILFFEFFCTLLFFSFFTP